MIADLTPDEERARLLNALAHAQEAMVLADRVARTPHHYLAMAARALEALVSQEPQSLSGGAAPPTTIR